MKQRLKSHFLAATYTARVTAPARARQIAFLVECLKDTHLAVFVPGVPNPQSGSVYLMTEDRIKPVGIPPAAALKCLTRLGAGSSALLREIDGLDTHTTKVQ